MCVSWQSLGFCIHVHVAECHTWNGGGNANGVSGMRDKL